MQKAEAETLMSRLANAFDRDLSSARRMMYVERLEAWDYEIGRRAVNHLTDTEDRFPSIAKLIASCNYFSGQMRPGKRDEAEMPLEAAALQNYAELMAQEAAERRARHGGKADWLVLLLEHGAEIYAQNAQRRARGVAALPTPKIDPIIQGLVKTI